MSAMSFWIWPTLKGDSCSTGERYLTTRAETLSKERDSSCVPHHQTTSHKRWVRKAEILIALSLLSPIQVPQRTQTGENTFGWQRASAELQLTLNALPQTPPSCFV